MTELGTYFIDTLGCAGYLYSFTSASDNIRFPLGSTITTEIIIKGGIYEGYKGNIIIDVVDTVLRNITIEIFA